MGAAQSQRNRIVSSRQADDQLDEEKRHFFEVLDRINSMARGTLKPFDTVVIVPPQSGSGYWWLMRAGEDRNSHYAFCYRDLNSLMKTWSLAVTGFASDKVGSFYTTEIV